MNRKQVRRLTAALADLPEPAVPAGLAAATMARIARLEDQQTADGRDRSQRDEAPGGRLAWALTLIGHAAGLAALVFVVLVSGSAPDVTSSRIGGMGSLVKMPVAAPVSLALAAGLLLYVAGLFAPLRSRRASEVSR